jgi:voltage-dependent anion channel protein 2
MNGLGDNETVTDAVLQVKINDRGIAAVAYNVLLRPGVTLGLGASFDTQKLDQATHKIGTSFVFDA